MEKINVVKVRNKQQMNDFIRIVNVVYRNCEQYVPDLERDIRSAFNQQKNAGMDFSDLQPFVAYKGKEVVGRIVGIINRKANERWNTSKVRFGLIEFVDDAEGIPAQSRGGLGPREGDERDYRPDGHHRL